MVFNRTNDTSARARTHALIQFNCNTTSARTSAAQWLVCSLLSLHFADNFPFTFPHRFQFGWQKPTRRRRQTKERLFDVRVIVYRHSLAGRHYTLHDRVHRDTLCAHCIAKYLTQAQIAIAAPKEATWCRDQEVWPRPSNLHRFEAPIAGAGQQAQLAWFTCYARVAKYFLGKMDYLDLQRLRRWLIKKSIRRRTFLTVCASKR